MEQRNQQPYPETSQPSTLHNIGQPALQPNSARLTSIRCPPFWPSSPALWFAQVENLFSIADVTDEQTRFSYVVSHLEQQIAQEVEDIIINPPDVNRYQRLKLELIRRLSTSRDQEVRQLLSREEMGERTPSQFLRHLRNLAKSDFSEDILRMLWADRLPPQVQAIIAAQSSTPLNDVALVADKVHAITIPRVAAISSARQVERLQSPTRDLKVDMLTKQVEELTTQVSALTSTTRIVNHTLRRDRSFARDHHGHFSRRTSQ
jgi:hypothetical protein